MQSILHKVDKRKQFDLLPQTKFHMHGAKQRLIQSIQAMAFMEFSRMVGLTTIQSKAQWLDPLAVDKHPGLRGKILLDIAIQTFFVLRIRGVVKTVRGRHRVVV